MQTKFNNIKHSISQMKEQISLVDSQMVNENLTAQYGLRMNKKRKKKVKRHIKQMMNRANSAFEPKSWDRHSRDQMSS